MKNSGILAMVLVLATLAGGCSSVVSEPVSRTSTFFDTVVQIDIYDKNAEEVLDGCMELCQGYEEKFSRTREGSEIWQLNHAGGQAVTLSQDTVDVIRLGLHYGELTGGALDITIAPLTDLWDIKNNPGTLPDAAAIESARSHVNYENVRVDGTTVQLMDPAASVDLGAVAKGYVADRLKEYLEDQGIASALINLGGNILAVGGKPDGTSFNISVQYPFREQGESITSIKIKDKSVVSSGPYQRYFELDGKIYHHILDPASGRPSDNGLSSVTIVADSSADADCLSTACFVLGLQQGMELIDSLDNAEALFITSDYKLYYSSGFQK